MKLLRMLNNIPFLHAPGIVQQMYHVNLSHLLEVFCTESDMEDEEDSDESERDSEEESDGEGSSEDEEVMSDDDRVSVDRGTNDESGDLYFN